MHTLPLHKFRAQLAQTLDRVLQGERIQVTRRGIAVIELRALQRDSVAAVPLWKQARKPHPLTRGAFASAVNPVLAERESQRY